MSSTDNNYRVELKKRQKMSRITIVLFSYPTRLTLLVSFFNNVFSFYVIFNMINSTLVQNNLCSAHVISFKLGRREKEEQMLIDEADLDS